MDLALTALEEIFFIWQIDITLGRVMTQLQNISVIELHHLKHAFLVCEF